MGAMRWAVPVVLVGALGLTGCSAGQLSVHAGSDTTASIAHISLEPTPTGKPIAPSVPLTLAASQGRLTDVVVEGPLPRTNRHGFRGVDGARHRRLRT